MSQRTGILDKLVALVGGDVISIVDPRDAWPALVTIALSGEPLLVSLHVRPVGLSHRDRDNVERRFQNPGQNNPVVQLPGTIPLLIGIWEEGPNPVLVAMGDVMSRIGTLTRQSLFLKLSMLRQAAVFGWDQYDSARYERITAFHPRLLSAYVEMVVENASIPTESILTVLGASGINKVDDLAPAERARRATMALVRDQAFRRKVLGAYDARCAMCSLNLGLVEGAHIYPASAPNSPDEVWNGLALCSNHHGAFDMHVIHVEPATRRITVHPNFRTIAEAREPCRRFLETTFDTLIVPASPTAQPRPDMFAQRYEFYEAHYAWAA